VAVALVRLIENGHVEHTGLIFEVEKDDAAAGGGWRETKAHGVSHHERRLTIVEFFARLGAG
jgi:hypothetical protein